MIDITKLADDAAAYADLLEIEQRARGLVANLNALELKLRNMENQADAELQEIAALPANEQLAHAARVLALTDKRDTARGVRLALGVKIGRPAAALEDGGKAPA